MSYYTYPVHGLGFMPDPDSVQDHDTLEDAYTAFVEDIRVTCDAHDMELIPDTMPTLEDARDSMPNGLAYGVRGWIHVISAPIEPNPVAR